MIRILHFGLSPHLGGIETYLYKISNSINKNKYQFDFLVTGNEKDVCYYKELIGIGCKFYSITPRNISLFEQKKDIKNLFENEEFDIVHCHMNSLSNILPIMLALKYKKKVIVHSRNGQLSNNYALKTKLLHYYNAIRLPKSKIKMLAVSNLAGTWMFGKDTNFTVVNNGIDIQKFKFNSDGRKTIRKQLDLKDKFCVVHVGAFRSQKNHMFILDIFKHLVQINPKSRLLLLGSGRLKSQFNKKAIELGIAKKIIMVGNKDNVSDYLSAGDVFLFPSLYEGFPNAVLEAQTSGLPCLISDTITKEVLINQNCRSYSLSKSPRNWAEKLLELPIYNDRMEGASKIEEKGFSVEDELKNLEKVYENLLE